MVYLLYHHYHSPHLNYFLLCGPNFQFHLFHPPNSHLSHKIFSSMQSEMLCLLGFVR